jgi:hypothetical protein
VLNPGEGRSLLAETLEKLVQPGCAALNLDLDVTRSIPHPAHEPMVQGQAMDKGPESDPLHDPGDREAQRRALNNRPVGYAGAVARTWFRRKPYH